MKRQQLTWSIREEDHLRAIKDFLQQQQLSRRALISIKFYGGDITVNGKKEDVRYLLRAGDELKVLFPPEDMNERLLAEDIDLPILYEDEHLLVVDKPPYMNTIPSREHPTGSLANGLKCYFTKTGVQTAIHIVTRLDRNTSGLVLVAKHRHAHHVLSRLQKEGRVNRYYEALAEGHFNQEEGTIDRPIGRKPDSIIEREVREDGKSAVTRYWVKGQADGLAWLRLELLTGRTHQIRVHLSASGHPLLGDELYGGSANKLARQALHCRELFLPHPFSDGHIHIVAPLPSDFKYLIDCLST